MSCDTDVGALFRENGYYLASNVFPESLLVEMEIEFDRIVEQLLNSGEQINARWEGEGVDSLDGGYSEIIHTHNPHRYSPFWWRVYQQDGFLAICREILGPDIVLHHSKLFQKPPGHGSPFPIHQDWGYFPTEKNSMIAAIFFLSDADDFSGGLRVYPGSHTLGRLENSKGQKGSGIPEQYSLENAVQVTAGRGDVLFFHYFTLHGSSPNRSAAKRKTLLVQLHAGDDRVECNASEHVNECLVLSGWNYQMTRKQAKA